MRAALLALAFIPAVAVAQELEPRAYSNAPVGTHFAIATYTRLSGAVLLDPSLPVSDLTAKINIYALGYARFFGVLGRTASFAIVAPYLDADLRGQLFDAAAEAHRGGVGDLRLRGALNLIGHPALTPAEFVMRPSVLSGGASLSVVAPTGQYESYRFINVGTNRWAYKPEFGLSYPMGRWFTEASAGVWLFTDNDNFASGHRRSQDPLETYQFHLGYNFRPGLWLAADFGHYVGGRTAIDGVQKDDAQSNSRVGMVLSAPIGPGWSAKLAFSKGTVVRVGGDYRIASIAIQYRWFD